MRPVPVDAKGEKGPTPGQARGPNWRRTSPGLYVPADAEFDQPTQRIVEAAALLPPGGAVSGWASLHLAGARYFDGRLPATELPVLLALGPRGHLPERPGIVQHRQTFAAEEVVMRHGVPCLHVDRALLDEMRRPKDLFDVVGDLDMAMYAELTSLARFTAYVDSQPRREGMERVRIAIGLACERSQSRKETDTRLTWELVAKLPRPLCNVPVVDEQGRFLGRPDLLDAIAGVAGEYDGEHNRATAQRRRDIGREEGFREHGLEYFSVVAGETQNREALARRMLAVRARALASARPRRWRLGKMDGLDLDERIRRREGGRRWL